MSKTSEYQRQYESLASRENRLRIITALTQKITDATNRIPDLESRELHQLVTGIEQIVKKRSGTFDGFTFNEGTNTYSYRHIFSTKWEFEMNGTGTSRIVKLTPEIIFSALFAAVNKTAAKDVSNVPMQIVKTGTPTALYKARIKGSIALLMQIQSDSLDAHISPESIAPVDVIFAVQLPKNRRNRIVDENTKKFFDEIGEIPPFSPTTGEHA